MKDSLVRRALCIVVASMCIFNSISTMAMSTQEYEVVTEEQQIVIETSKIYKSGSDINIDGAVNITESIANLHAGIISLLNDKTETYAKYEFGNNEFNNFNSIYSSNSIMISANNIKIANIIVAEGDININASNVESDKLTIVYSKKGNININASNVVLNGLLYAPNGNVKFSASAVKVNGEIFSKLVDIAVGSFNISTNSECQCMIKGLMTVMNTPVLNAAAEWGNNNCEISVTSNYDIESIKVYTRVDNDNEFSLIGVAKDVKINSDLIFNSYLDIIVIGTTKFGDEIDSNLLTYVKEENEMYSDIRDTDNDGLEDGIEIWRLKTNPYEADTDNDGFQDGIEVNYLYTNPLIVDEDLDFDNDGLSNKMEIECGSNPYLKDSDFDGIEDNVDIEPIKYNSNTKIDINYSEEYIASEYDVEISYVDENKKVIRKIFNGINGLEKCRIESDEVKLFYYDILGNLVVELTSSNETSYAISYTYWGKEITSIAQNGYIYEFLYKENTISDIRLNGISMVSYNYANNYTEECYGNGFSTKSCFNNNFLTNTFENSKENFEYIYNDLGNLIRIIDKRNGLECTYNYTEDEAYKSIEVSTGYKIEYNYYEDIFSTTYSILDKKYAQITDSGFKEDNSIKSHKTILISGDEMVTKINENTTNIEIYNQDSIVRLEKITYNGNNIERIENENGEVYIYKYSKGGLLEKEYVNDVLIKEYTYNKNGNLIKEMDYENCYNYNYCYDKFGNILSSSKYKLIDGIVSNEVEINNYKYNSQYRDQLISYNETNIWYDEIGNPIKYGDISMKWIGRKLSNWNNTDYNINYIYDSDGNRIEKQVNGKSIKYNYEGNDIISETFDDKTIVYIYDAYANIIGFIYNDCTYYYDKNSYNDIIAIRDKNNVVCRYKYDAWGNILCIEGDKELGELNPIRYRSYYYDKESKLYYLESRYYDSNIGRFISTDDVNMLLYNNNNLNLYSYCNNNPIGYYDPTGCAQKKVIVMYDVNSFSDMGEVIAQQMYNYFGNAIKLLWRIGDIDNSSDVQNNVKWFKEYWSSEVKKYDVAVLLGHGSSQNIFKNTAKGSSIFQLGRNNIQSLDKINLDLLILISCNVGHYASKWTNVAYEFSKKISGIVVASDGTVELNLMDYGLFKSVLISSINDNQWKNYEISAGGRRTSNEGWVIYKTLPGVTVIYTTTLGKSRINIIDICKYVKSCGLFK